MNAMHYDRHCEAKLHVLVLSLESVTAGIGSLNGLQLLSHTELHVGYLSSITK